MTTKELLIHLFLAAVVCAAIVAIFAINNQHDKRQYLHQCACENCRCRCHIHAGLPSQEIPRN